MLFFSMATTFEWKENTFREEGNKTLFNLCGLLIDWDHANGRNGPPSQYYYELNGKCDGDNIILNRVYEKEIIKWAIPKR